jgi:hypothetical protein
LAAPKEIVDLVEKFERNRHEYKSKNYSEMHTRQEFINPFFKVLGWDMYNDQGFSEAYKEVLHQPNLPVGNATIAPDYVFRVGGSIKFLVEAKKPSIKLAKNADPAHQLRSYAWNAQIPISIITNFKEFAIYDCRYPPNKTDNVDTAIISYLEHIDYDACWSWISNKFSKTAIQSGCLDNLEEISSWESELKSLRSQRRVKRRIDMLYGTE